MQYRPAELSDLEGVLSAVRSLATEQREFGSRIAPTESESALRSHLAGQIVDGDIIVATHDATIVGIATVSIDTGALTRTETVGRVEYLSVDADHRGGGVGAELLERAEARLADRGVTVVELEVLAENEDARSFYASRGYDIHRHRLAKRVGESTQSE